ncbi:bifunctional hydroxymethylpyrimidine kinase/phosphomethylpyrimidine kinase [Pseudooceanicola nitratireducens]|uniref:bifunctional hydroxymethylpyrimidine kinase/phosphomethylpyrimidine kinase n=1 Tax=Pseudooceanicola nitratireducens TaxID=517719 RepID=UPI003C7BA1F9
MTRVLVIGGLDSSGGAGILRDVATITRLGGQARVAVTAVTAQTDQAGFACDPVTPEVVQAQIRAAGPVDAVKIGMLCNGAITRMVAATLAEILTATPTETRAEAVQAGLKEGPPRDHAQTMTKTCVPAGLPIVLDPVLMSSSGMVLLDADGKDALVTTLLPLCSVVTPNLPELAALSPLSTGETARVGHLLRHGAGAVLVKGGHGSDRAQVEDRLYKRDDTPLRFAAPRIDRTLRGTGCHLASAMAVSLARGCGLSQAVREAREDLLLRFHTA